MKSVMELPSILLVLCKYGVYLGLGLLTQVLINWSIFIRLFSGCFDLQGFIEVWDDRFCCVMMNMGRELMISNLLQVLCSMGLSVWCVLLGLRQQAMKIVSSRARLGLCCVEDCVAVWPWWKGWVSSCREERKLSCWSFKIKNFDIVN